MAPPAGVSWRRTCSPPHAPVTLASRSSGDVGAQALTSMNAAPVARHTRPPVPRRAHCKRPRPPGWHAQLDTGELGILMERFERVVRKIHHPATTEPPRCAPGLVTADSK